MPAQPAAQAADRLEGRAPGRPRDAAIDELVLRTTLDLLVDEGLPGTTIQAVADRCGVARATIYLRWPGRTALILAALNWSIRRPPFELSGDIETDIRAAARQARLIASQPTFVAAMPALMQAFLGPGLERGLTFDSLFPNRLRIVDEYRQRAAEQGHRADLDPVTVIDALIGALLMRLITTGRPPTEAYAEHVVELVLAGTRTGPGA